MIPESNIAEMFRVSQDYIGNQPGDSKRALAILAQVSDYVPTLRNRAYETEKLGRVPVQTIEDLSSIGVFNMGVPVEYGGFALTPTQQHAIFAEIARGCGSTAWVAWVTGAGQQWMGLFDQQFQDESYGAGWKGPLNSGVANGAGPGIARKVSGGYMLKGRWPFCSGCHYTLFHHLGAKLIDKDGELILCQVPHSEVGILDDWDVMGLKGSGSNSVTLVEEVFVPEHRVRTVADLMAMKRTAAAPAGLAFKLSLSVFTAATMTAVGLGQARAAIEILREKIPTRGITNSIYKRQNEAPITHIQLGELHCKLEAAEHIAASNLQRAEEGAEAGIVPDELATARTNLETAYVLKLCSEITELVLRASGAASIHEANIFQRLFRDTRVPTLHGRHTIETCLEDFGRASVNMLGSDAVMRI
jgi:alkylation response protein AidB-like acyl-CoA dehydrogenase